MHPIVQRFVDTFFYLLKLCHLSAALQSEWAFGTVTFAAPILLFVIAFAIRFDPFVGQVGSLSSLFFTLIAVGFNVVFKSWAIWFVESKIRNVCIYTVLFTTPNTREK